MGVVSDNFTLFIKNHPCKSQFRYETVHKSKTFYKTLQSRNV